MARPKINELEPNGAGALDSLTILTSTPEQAEIARLTAELAQLRGGPAVPPIPGVPVYLGSTRKTSKPKKAAPKFLQESEITALLKVIHEPRDRAMFQIAYRAGLRASEVGLLDMRHYNPKTDRLFVTRLKGSNSGEHPLCREESRALRAWLKIRGTGPGIIFPSRKGEPISRQMLDVLIKRYGRLAGVPRELRHFHVLKHSCATHLLSRGFHVEQVQDWIGHANIQNTMIYAKLTNSRRDEMAERLKDAW